MKILLALMILIGCETTSIITMDADSLKEYIGYYVEPDFVDQFYMYYRTSDTTYYKVFVSKDRKEIYIRVYLEPGFMSASYTKKHNSSNYPAWIIDDDLKLRNEELWYKFVAYMKEREANNAGFQ